MDLELSVDLDVQVDEARNIRVESKMMNNLHLNSFMQVDIMNQQLCQPRNQILVILTPCVNQPFHSLMPVRTFGFHHCFVFVSSDKSLKTWLWAQICRFRCELYLLMTIKIEQLCYVKTQFFSKDVFFYIKHIHCKNVSRIEFAK